ncbi:MAG: C40 family peptidase [Alphaproteobacteria bacterium]|nr:C40 family peptidase [Alphaproteobacteria bacterium]MBU1516706.1 C40 family peptidase [Alphaproteobacteria bacterium]MBU2095920.1 C40 family peptidase [Alphaproteobacteria bacterium]MBU2153624.1 C40 family peptidase [Alphaproteobacteria bacterium]MBU2307332.1 C40 family peptidase [Alphaproteobacteria bacterium]
MKHDPRITPWRDGIAARSLEGVLEAEVYLDPKAMSCMAPAAAIRSAPDANAEQMDQILFGERFEVLEEEGGWLFGQAARDGYVGFVEAAALQPAGPMPTHRVAALRTYAFAEASIKSRALGPYSINSLVTVETVEGKLAKVTGAGWMTAAHLTPIGQFEEDWAAVAERFVGAPYLWGGRESLGLDCSGLTQQALFACGRACPRDTDQQQALGLEIAAADFGRGDLVFWKGHVALGLGDGRIVHANGHHMATVTEPLSAAIARIDANGSGQPTSYRRV